MDLQAFYQLPDRRDELQRGMTVAWNRSKLVQPPRQPVLVGQVVRVARDKRWADVCYEIPLAERSELAQAWDITHKTERLSTLYLRQVVEASGVDPDNEET